MAPVPDVASVVVSAAGALQRAGGCVYSSGTPLCRPHLAAASEPWRQPIGCRGRQSAGTHLASLASFRHLDLKANRIGSGGPVVLAHPLACLTSVQQLSFSCNRIDAGSVKALSPFLARLLLLHHLDLGNNNTCAEGDRALGANLASSPSCCTLILRRTRLVPRALDCCGLVLQG